MITKPWADLFAVVGLDSYLEALATQLRRCSWSEAEIAVELAEVRAAMEQDTEEQEQSFAV